MIAVDTNILVRYVVKDDRRQAAAAMRFLQHTESLLLPTVVLETVWVLSSKKGYAIDRKTVAAKIRHIAGLPHMIVPEPKPLAIALDWYESGMDFADALHLSLSSGYGGFATLDKKMWLCAENLGLAEQVVLLPLGQDAE